MPMTAPNVSRRGTRGGTAPPVGATASALGAAGIDVTGVVREVAMGVPSLAVVIGGWLVAELEANSTVLLGPVLDEAPDELEADGLSRKDTTMSTG